MGKSFLAVLISGVLFNAADAADSQPLRIGWVYALANAPALIAEKEGFYQQEGLTVELKSFGDGPVISQALAAHELDAAYMGATPVFQWFSRGLKGQIIAKVNSGQAALIVPAQSAISRLADLKGKRIAGVKKGSGMDVLLRGVVLQQQAGLVADKDAQILSMPAGNMPAALQQGVVDAAFTWEPFVSEALLRGDARLLLDVNKVQPGYPWYVLMALPETLKDRPDDVVKLIRAHQKAVDFINQHPAEADRIMADAFKLRAIKTADGKTLPPAALVQEARKRIEWSVSLTKKDGAFFEQLMKDSQTLGYMQKAPELNEFVDTQWLTKAGITQ
ncbi:ABC transporter substrate-binding protein [Klebsiella michiganensis]|uniref:ABC transporter substrate-binding protein n=1 Tax=Klebsiella michiganensis TaxID=1134687 RepID=UPI0022474CD5|nr:ABC transporter substrate-binding protein [Klebsiella michiganensis]MCW9490755.1 ABC transporter substrate-binding protein [Klebsiella michiganensis]MDU7369267.1 ABC transporter substrate-binding protein [Klebsiella michiganensis]HDX8707664.1 ABC transporter substrate-binding protein [Klebsiella michiganensis]HDX9184390.1 ABC transporter substrate-binding protein [Klebsiella michiganensis]